MGTRASINFDLLNNAKDSLRQAVVLLAYGDIEGHSRLKHAIMNAAHCVELLLKERLRRIDPALVWENVKRYPSLDARTVTVDKAIDRLRGKGNVVISVQDEDIVKSIRRTRNAIEHYEWNTSEKEAKRMIGSTLSFIFGFGKNELNTDLSLDFKEDDTWEMLMSESFEFTSIYGERVGRELQSRNDFGLLCKRCGTETVSVKNESCELCGHWQAIEYDEE